jgi:NodT family efflux transporter outer membrane factor (OMF) lipoprotein
MNCPAPALLCALLLCAGCTVARYQRPLVNVPSTYRGEEPPGPSRETLGELRWEDLIRDEDLSRLIREALAHNFDAEIAAARVLEVRAQFGMSRSALFPALDAQTGYNNLRSSENGLSPMPGGFSTEVDYTNFSASLGWEIDLWGRIRNANAAARAALLASEDGRSVVLQTLVSDVAGGYFLLLDLDQEVEITRHALQLREDSLELIQLRLDYGYSSGLDFRQAEVLVKSARTSLTSLELAREQAENRLAVLLGRNPGPMARGRSLLEQESTPGLPAGLPSTLLNRRPDIRQAEQQLIGDQALVAVAKAAFFPRLSLTATSGFESSDLLKIFNPSNSTWAFAPLTNLPIFNAGRIRAGVRSAEARRLQSLLVYRKTVQLAFREVADALTGRRKLAELQAGQAELVESLRQAVDLADLRYRGGVSSYLEYLDSERQLLDAQLRLVQIRREGLTNTVALYRALGGGWQ